MQEEEEAEGEVEKRKEDDGGGSAVWYGAVFVPYRTAGERRNGPQNRPNMPLSYWYYWYGLVITKDRVA